MLLVKVKGEANLSDRTLKSILTKFCQINNVKERERDRETEKSSMQSYYVLFVAIIGTQISDRYMIFKFKIDKGYTTPSVMSKKEEIQRILV